MGRLRTQEAEFFDSVPPSELAARLVSEPERLQEIANRGPERALNALLATIGGLTLMVRTDARLALIAVALRAPLLAQLATAAGRVVGRLNARQQEAKHPQQLHTALASPTIQTSITPLRARPSKQRASNSLSASACRP